MDRRSFLASAGSASLAALMAGAPAALAQTASVGNADDARLSALLDDIFAGFIERTPEFATTLGLDKGERAGLKSQLSDYSAASRSRELGEARARLADLRKLDRAKLSTTGALHYDIVDYLLSTSTGARGRFTYGNIGDAGGFVPYVISQQDGAYQSVPDFLDSQHRVANKADADAYLARLEAFATAIDQNSEAQRQDAARGVFAPGFSLDTTLAQLDAIRRQPAVQTVLVTSIARRAKAAGIQGDHAARAEAVVAGKIFPALDRQIALVRQLRARATDDAGVWRLPDGAAYYDAAVKAETTTRMTPDEVHRMGLEQVAEISGRIDSILKGQGMTRGSVGERLTALNADPKQLYPNSDRGRAALLDSLNGQMRELDRLLPNAFATLPKAKVEVVRVPTFIQDGASNGYYNSAALDGSRPARYYINLKDTGDWPKYGLASLTYHEASPGHHLQISLAQESPSTPMLLKLSPFGAYTEGWALYAEQLADEMGVYAKDPLGQAGYLQSLLFRAARLVVDTGIHDKRWSRDKAVDYMVQTIGFPRPRTQREIDRYCVSPGQACSYKVGHTMWVRVRDDAKAKLGPKFDLKQFHQVLLKGALPLTILEQEVAAWVRTQRA
jgi:uncharacterized protein (DUF885 family)